MATITKSLNYGHGNLHSDRQLKCPEGSAFLLKKSGFANEASFAPELTIFQNSMLPCLFLC